jgi:hypothetical protein
MLRWRYGLIVAAFAFATVTMVAVCVRDVPSWLGLGKRPSSAAAVAQAEPVDDRPEDGNDTPGTQHESRAFDARADKIEQLIAKIEADYPTWADDEKPIRQTIVSELFAVDHKLGIWSARTLGAAHSPEAVAAGQAIWQALNDLHAMTGHCEFTGLTCEQAVAQAPEICARYRSWLGGLPKQDEAARMRAAIYENIELLRTNRWWFALKCIQDHVALGELWDVTGEGGVFAAALPERASEYLHSTMFTWWTDVGPEFEWDPVGQRFWRPVSSADLKDGPLEWDPVARKYKQTVIFIGLPRLPFDVSKLYDLMGMSPTAPEEIEKPPKTPSDVP